MLKMESLLSFETLISLDTLHNLTEDPNWYNTAPRTTSVSQVPCVLFGGRNCHPGTDPSDVQIMSG
jgi:hypothetical protein